MTYWKDENKQKKRPGLVQLIKKLLPHNICILASFGTRKYNFSHQNYLIGILPLKASLFISG